MTLLRDLKGQTFGRAIVLRRGTNSRTGRVRWVCRCRCGKTFTAHSTTLVGGGTTSCGCALRDFMSALGRRNGTHRLSRTPEYGAWANMRRRCYDPKNNRFRLYGARGIWVCMRWRASFENFLADMGKKPTPKHSLDREDNDDCYKPTNCRWATASQQNKNRRPYKRKGRR